MANYKSDTKNTTKNHTNVNACARLDLCDDTFNVDYFFITHLCKFASVYVNPVNIYVYIRKRLLLKEHINF